MLLFYVFGVIGFMIPIMSLMQDYMMDEDGYKPIPGFLPFLLACITWPASLLFLGGGPLIVKSLDRFDRWCEKRKQLPPAPSKDKYLLEAEREVDAFLGYSDVPETVTKEAFEAIAVQGADCEGYTNQGVKTKKLINPWDFKVREVPVYKKGKKGQKISKAYNKYLIDIENEKIEYVNLYKNKIDAQHNEYTSTYSYYGDY
jgi:hypothetical protein